MPLTFKELNNRTPEQTPVAPAQAPARPSNWAVAAHDPEAEEQSPFGEKAAAAGHQVEGILRAGISNGDITESQAADLYDHHFDARNPSELADKLAPRSDVPDRIKHALYLTKVEQTPKPNALERGIQAIMRLAHLDRATLDKAEKNPTVLKLLSEAASKRKE